MLFMSVVFYGLYLVYYLVVLPAFTQLVFYISFISAFLTLTSDKPQGTSLTLVHTAIGYDAFNRNS